MSCCTKQLGDLFLDWTWASRTGVERANHQTITFPSGYIDVFFFVSLFFWSEIFNLLQVFVVNIW